jgi:hypothetical protein
MIDPNLMVRIRKRAYEIWEDEGRPEGRDRIHWLRAEAEFRESLCASRPASATPQLKPQKTPKPSSRAARADRAH